MVDPAEIVTVTLGDKTFQASRRTAGHLQWTIQRLASLHPGTHLHIIQTCYHVGTDASQGTHDKDAVVDIAIYGLTWGETQTFCRVHGWAAWWRQDWQGFSDHVHMVSLGTPENRLGDLVPDQINDYYHHAYGLHLLHDPGSDRSWFPADIGATIFDFARWEREMEDTVAYTDWPQADRDALKADLRKIVQDVVRNAVSTIPAGTAERVWATQVDDAPILIAKAALRKAAKESTP